MWDTWTEPGSQAPLTTFTIITTTANRLLKPIHDRMPVILPQTKEAAWLDPELTPQQALALLKPYAATAMQAYEVTTFVNSPRNDTPQAIQPVPRITLKR